MFAQAIRDNQDQMVCSFPKESESSSLAVNESRFFKRLKVTSFFFFLPITVIMAKTPVFTAQ